MDSTTTAATRYTDDAGHDHLPCHICGADCSTHPDAGNPLECCGDCGRATCPDHRVDDAAARCSDCAAAFYAAATTDGEQLAEALGRVLDRMGSKPETLAEAIEAVAPDYGGREFAAALAQYAGGKS